MGLLLENSPDGRLAEVDRIRVLPKDGQGYMGQKHELAATWARLAPTTCVGLGAALTCQDLHEAAEKALATWSRQTSNLIPTVMYVPDNPLQRPPLDSFLNHESMPRFLCAEALDLEIAALFAGGSYQPYGVRDSRSR